MSQSREIEKRINFKGKSNSHNTLNAAKMHSMSTTGKMFSLGSILFGVICFALCFLVAVIPVIISTDVSNYYQRFSVGLYSVVIPPEAEGIEPYQIMNVFGMLVIILGGLCLICAVPGIVINALTKTKFYIIPVALTLGSVLFMVAISFSATMDPQVITDNAGDINWMRDWVGETSHVGAIVLNFTTNGIIILMVLGLDAASVIGVVIAYTIKLVATTHNY